MPWPAMMLSSLPVVLWSSALPPSLLKNAARLLAKKLRA
jgi:hypothetical protein